MEQFPASNDEQFKFVKRVIDDCDYYVVIVAGRYGSVTSDGISFTEREFDYAVSIDIPILAFLHKAPDSIALGRSEIEEATRAKLTAFRAKVEFGRIVSYWTGADALAGKVVLSLVAAKNDYPRPGWVRGPKVDQVPLLSLNARLQAENAELRAAAAPTQSAPKSSGLAQGEQTFSVSVGVGDNGVFSFQPTWNQILTIVGGDAAFKAVSELDITRMLAQQLGRLFGKNVTQFSEVTQTCLQTIRLQLSSLGLITVVASPQGFLFWQLTSKGKSAYAALRAVPTSGGIDTTRTAR